MATRSGSVDPGALLYALREGKLTNEELDSELEHHSGLAALSGNGSGDIRDATELALIVFAYRVAGAVATMAMAAGGLDALVFTAGIGERSVEVRRRVIDRLGLLGVVIDQERNDAADPDCEIAAPGSSVRVVVLKAREELVAARHARSLLAPHDRPSTP